MNRKPPSPWALFLLFALGFSLAPREGQARDDWSSYGSLSYNPGMHSTSGFDLNPGRGYNFKCNLCNGQVYWIPTLDTSVAIRWISENHLPRVHGITPSNTAPASSSGGWKEIQHEAFKDMIDAQRDRDFRTRNQARNVFITATIMQPVSDLIRDSIYEFFNPTAAGPTPQEQARRRLESSQRYYREQNARSDFQLLQEMTLARSRAMREAEMDADRERSDRLSGAFDVFRSRRSNSFFGIEGNPSDEQVAAALSEDAGADPFRPFFDGTRPSDAAPGGTLGAFESQLRGDSVPFAEDPSVVVFDTDVLRAKVDPKFLADQARRAEATDQYWRSQAKGDFHGPPTGPPSPDLEQIGLALVDRGLKGERDSLIGLARSGLPTEANAQVNMIQKMFDKELIPKDIFDPSKFNDINSAPNRLGLGLLQEVWGKPETVRRLEEVRDQLQEKIRIMKRSAEILNQAKRLDYSEARDLFSGSRERVIALPMPPIAHHPSDPKGMEKESRPEIREILQREGEKHQAFKIQVMDVIDGMKLPAVDWRKPSRTLNEGVIEGLFTDPKDADQFMRQSPLPFPAKDKNSPKEYDALAKDGKAKGFSFGLGADQKAAELGRGVVDDLSLAKRTLGSEHGRALMNELNGTKFDRLLLHSNGATVGEALIRKGVIQVDTLHIAGGDRSLINGGLQELLDTGKVKKIVVWINPGDPVPIASANAVSAAAELYHEGNQWIVDTVTGMKRPSKGAQVEYRVLKGDEYQGQHLEGTDLFQAHHLTTYVANMRVYYRNHPTED